MTQTDLLVEIDNFLAKQGVEMTETTFGRLAVNDGKFVGRLRGGGGLTLATAEKVRIFISTHAASNRAGALG